MRLRKTDLRQRINGKLAVRYDATGLSSFVGLDLIRQYLSQLELSEAIRRHARQKLPGSHYGRMAVVLLVLVLLITGGRRARNVGYLETDPLVKRFCSLARVPVPRTVRRWLGALEYGWVDGLLSLNEVLVGRAINDGGLRPWCGSGYR